MEYENLSDQMGVMSMTWYISYWKVFQKLKTDREKVEYVEMLCKYCFYGEIPDENNNLIAVFEAIKPNIDSSILRKRKAKENGSRGGAPKGNQNARKDKQPNTTENNLNKNTDSDKEINKNENADKEKYDPRQDLVLLEEAMRETVCSWVDYKEGRTEAYSMESFKAWREILDEKIRDYDEGHVIAVIKYSIANQCKNVVWDRLANYPRKKRTLKSEESKKEKEIERLTPDEERNIIDDLYATLKSGSQ